MGTFTVDVCMTDGCGADISADTFAYYCPRCVARQMAEQARERAAFADFHAYADRIARGRS